MSLQSRLSALITSIGADIKTLQGQITAIPGSAKDQDNGRALRTFRGSYLGGSTSNPTDILIVGASFEEGAGSTLMTNGWTNVFRDVLRFFAQPKSMAGGGSTSASTSTTQAGVGNYYGFSGSLRFNGVSSDAYPDSPIIATSGSGFTNAYTGGLGLRALIVANGSWLTLEWFGTGIDLVYVTDPTAGSFTYSIDGASAVTVATTPASANGQRTSIRGLARGRHTITLTTTVAGAWGSGVIYEGVVFYDGDESGGIRVWQAAHSGYGAKDFVSGTGNTNWVNSIQTWNIPDLVVINLGFNDWQAGRTAAQIKTDLQSIISLIKSRCTTLGGVTPSIVVMSSFKVLGLGAPTDTWENVVTAFNDIATTDDDVCIFDYQHWFGKTTDTAISTRGGILVSDGVHPTDGGHAIIGGAMANFVLDSSERARDVIRYGVKPAEPTYNALLTTPAAGFATDTYVPNSSAAIPLGRLKPGSWYRCKTKVSKTAAGLVAPIVQVRVGTAGTIADTSRATLTFAAQTGVADDGFIEVFVTVRVYGASAILHVVGVLDHKLAATGLSTSNTSIVETTSSAFDITAATFIGLSLNAGTSASWTVSMVQAELQNLA